MEPSLAVQLDRLSFLFVLCTDRHTRPCAGTHTWKKHSRGNTSTCTFFIQLDFHQLNKMYLLRERASQSTFDSIYLCSFSPQCGQTRVSLLCIPWSCGFPVLVFVFQIQTKVQAWKNILHFRLLTFALQYCSHHNTAACKWTGAPHVDVHV